MRRFERAAPFAAGVVILFLSIPCVAQSGAGADKGAKLYVEKCSLCRSVGGGDLAGPDRPAGGRTYNNRDEAALGHGVRRSED